MDYYDIYEKRLKRWGETSKEKTLLFSINDEEKKQNIISELTK